MVGVEKRDVVKYRIENGVAVLTIERPPVNAINVDVRRGIIDGITKANADPAVRAVVLTCSGRTFLSGADLSELESGIIQAPDWPSMIGAIEGSIKPVVAALFGSALGGGLETAMACHYRVALSSARVGMPEINLGILPGAGGTQRLPRLVGAKQALEIMLKGAPISAGEAREIGLVDELVEDELTANAMSAAKRITAPRRTSELKANADGFDEAGIAQILEANARALKGRTTQHDLVRLVQSAVSDSFETGMAEEKKLSDASLKSPEGRALIHIFFAESKAARIPGLPPSVRPKPIAKAAVIGAGTMGGGIAMALADAGVLVVLIEANKDNLEHGLAMVRANYETSVARGKLTQSQLEQRMGLFEGHLDLAAAHDVDLVIEAVFENMALKKSVIGKLDQICRPDTILASNTSSLSLSEIASVTSRPDKVVGLHFFSPANVMRLLEIVRGERTSQETLATALDVAKKLRKIGVVSGDGFGFIGNRMMQDGEFREAELMLLQGAPPERIDRVAEAFGFAMGPNRVNDMAGIDIGTKVRIELFKRADRAPPYHVVSDELTRRGLLGQKSGKGFYVYEGRGGKAYPELSEMIGALAGEHSVAPRDMTDKEIEERLVLSLVNVGAEVLEDGIAYRASDLDVVWTSGYGFPRHRGGPMFYADELGLKHVLERVNHYHAVLGEYWKPAPLLERLAKAGGSFAQWDAERA